MVVRSSYTPKRYRPDICAWIHTRLASLKKHTTTSSYELKLLASTGVASTGVAS